MRGLTESVAGLAAGLVIGVSAGIASAQPGPPPATVRVDLARMEVIEQRRPVTGELRATRRSMLASQAEGLVVRLCCREGDVVNAGDEIAGLDDTLAAIAVEGAESAVASAEATVAEREAQLERATIEVDRIASLVKRSSASPSEVDDARTAQASAKARLAQAKAELATRKTELARATEDLADMRIRAPFSGQIVMRAVEVGQWVDLGGDVVEIVALDTVEAWLDVPQTMADRIRTGDVRARVRIEATGQELEAPIASVIPSADPRSRLFPVRVVLDNADGRLKPGMSVVGLLPTGSAEPTLTVSKDAILRNDAGEFVYWNAGGTAVVAPVQRLFAQGLRVAVRAPALRPGAEVVIEGNERLFPGQPLNVMNPTVDPAAAPAESAGEQGSQTAPESARAGS